MLWRSWIWRSDGRGGRCYWGWMRFGGDFGARNAVSTWFSGRVIAAGAAVGASAGRRDAAVGSGSGGERADRVEHGGEVVLPGPAGGHPQRPLAAGAGQAGGNVEEVAAAGAAVCTGRLGCPIWVVQRPRLCAIAAITVHALLACIRPLGK